MADNVDNNLARELEEMEDQRDAVTFMLARMEQANDEPRPWSVVERLHAGEHPVAVFRDLRGLTLEELANAVGSETATIAQVLRVDLDDLVPWAHATGALPARV